jgi:hypothetical protein
VASSRQLRPDSRTQLLAGVRREPKPANGLQAICAATLIDVLTVTSTHWISETMMTVFHDEYRSTLGRTLSDRVATFLDNLPSYDRLQLARVSQALHMLAVLGIPDRLADGPCSSQDLAAFVGAADEPLYRLLRAMAAIGVLEELPERRFALSEGLRSDVSGSLAGWEPQPRVASQEADQTAPSLPVAKRLRYLSFDHHKAVTVAPGQ